jgi:diguanylate cyclase (GGDEF)-like protein
LILGLFRALALFTVPIALLAGAFALVFYSGALPASLSGLKDYGPYIMFSIGTTLALAFNRGRAALALVVLAGAYVVQQVWLQQGLDTPAARAAYAGLTVFVPINLAVLAALPERGTFNHYGVLRLGIIVLQAAFVAWVVAAGQPAILDLAYEKFLDPAPFSAGRIPQLGIALTGLALLITAVPVLVSRSVIHAGLAGAIAAFAIAAHVPNASLTFAIFITMAELMVTVAVLQDTFRMAFRDELTGLPSRRALNERLEGLGNRYAIAMLDVDHFKKFNDTYGHDLGDQVLKMVATRIAGVGGGGKAYRYGGEEFTVLFPGRETSQALPYLEGLREEVESYRLAMRGSERPRKVKNGKRQPGSFRGGEGVSVTISIGVAERNERLVTPQAVLKAADRALYRAKEKGRNRVSR